MIPRLRRLRPLRGMSVAALLLAPLFMSGLCAQIDPIPGSKTPKYDSRGKRDPFISLYTLRKPPEVRTLEPPPLNQRPPGLPGLLVDEVTVVGVVNGGEGPLLLLKGVDGMTYFARQNDRLFDGNVAEIEDDQVRFIREIRDTQGRTHRSRVTKRLYTQEVQEVRVDEEKGEQKNEKP